MGPIPDVDVELSRARWDRTKESEKSYRDREQFLATFDEFVRQSGISEERKRTVLALLYEYQEGSQHYLERLLHWSRRGEPERAGDDVSLRVLHHKIGRYLTVDELRAWERTMDLIPYFLDLKLADQLGGDYIVPRQP